MSVYDTNISYHNRHAKWHQLDEQRETTIFNLLWDTDGNLARSWTYPLPCQRFPAQKLIVKGRSLTSGVLTDISVNLDSR